MPVTARLSQLFYERVGEQVANELVDWFNAVDATYRSDLRELNELNFARFDAKLEQRLADLHNKLDSKIDKLDSKIDWVETKFERRVAELQADVRVQLADQRADLLKWMFVYWAGTTLPLAGLMLLLHRL